MASHSAQPEVGPEGMFSLPAWSAVVLRQG